MTDERVAVITGAAQGIGRRTAQVLAAEGHLLATIDRQPVEDLDGLSFVGDVSDETDVAAFATAVHDAYGRVDVLVNNAGIASIAPAEETPPARWREVLEVNLTGPFLLSQAFGRRMLARGSGSIVNIASVAGLMGVADRVAYNTSKHGLIGLTRTLAVEWGGRGVRVNAVCPGWVKTEMDETSQSSGAYGDLDIVEHVPMARFAQPDDIAQAVAFLADPAKSGFVNGATLSVDGGWHADGSWQSLRLSTRPRLQGGSPSYRFTRQRGPLLTAPTATADPVAAKGHPIHVLLRSEHLWKILGEASTLTRVSDPAPSWPPADEPADRADDATCESVNLAADRTADLADLADLAAGLAADLSAVSDDEPSAATIAALLDNPLTPAADLADAVAWCYDDAALPLLLPLAHHADARVRRAVAQALPSVLGDTSPDAVVSALVGLSTDADDDVRDWACFALGTQLCEVDGPMVRDALVMRMSDPHDDTRCEAVLGLARRRDTRVLPVLRERLSSQNVYSLEIDAAGALGDPSLHTMVRGHLSGWDDDVVARVCAALRLTDPDGVGDDLLDGLAHWYRDGAPHANDDERYWWSVTLQVLEHAEYRAPEIAAEVLRRLAGHERAIELMLSSRLAQLAGDHGWPHWR